MSSSSTSSAAAAAPRPSNAELQVQYNTFKDAITDLVSKIAELEGDLDEHKLVLDTLSTIPKERKCFRMIGGTLVESTVKEVSPNLTSNSEQLVRVISVLKGKLSEAKEKLSQWQAKYNVQIVAAN